MWLVLVVDQLRGHVLVPMAEQMLYVQKRILHVLSMVLVITPLSFIVLQVSHEPMILEYVDEYPHGVVLVQEEELM